MSREVVLRLMLRDAVEPPAHNAAYEQHAIVPLAMFKEHDDFVKIGKQCAASPP